MNLQDLLQEQKKEFIEKGADIEHTRWSNWQEYFFSKCKIEDTNQYNGVGDTHVYFALESYLYNRWKQQIATPYSELSEEEKESDRREVRTYLPLLTTAITKGYELALEEVKREIEGNEIVEDYAKANMYDQELKKLHLEADLHFNRGLKRAIEIIDAHLKETKE